MRARSRSRSTSSVSGHPQRAEQRSPVLRSLDGNCDAALERYSVERIRLGLIDHNLRAAVLHHARPSGILTPRDTGRQAHSQNQNAHYCLHIFTSSGPWTQARLSQACKPGAGPGSDILRQPSASFQDLEERNRAPAIRKPSGVTQLCDAAAGNGHDAR